MKRVASIILFVLMLVIAIPPTMRLHFCGGQLASVSMWTKDAGCSCGKMNHPNETKQSKLGDELASTSCCHVSQIGLAVGNYQIQTHDFQINPHVFQCSDLASCILFNLTITSHNIAVQSNAPPDPIACKGTDILTHNCIYRI